MFCIWKCSVQTCVRGLNNAAFVQKSYTFTPTTTGVYYFSFLHNSPANATGTHALLIDTFEVTQQLSTDNFNASSISVYPNPVRDIVAIEGSNYSNIQSYKIADLNGRIVKSGTANTTSAQVNMSDLQTGVYMMTINSDKGSVVKKIIKE